MEEAVLSAVDELRRLEPAQRASALLDRPPQQALAIFEQLEAPLQQDLLDWLPDREMDRLLMELDPDDRVRLLDTLPQPVAGKLLSHLSLREWRLTQKLLSYPAETAGHIMTPEYLPLLASLSAEQALARLRRQARDDAAHLSVLPVLDSEGHLEGLVNLSSLVLALPEQPVSDLMLTEVPRVSPETDQEQVARLIQLADLLALPVVDRDGRLLGLVTVDDALDILHLEREEDFARSGASEPLTRPYFAIGMRQLARSRLLWLLLLAVAGALTVQVLQIFEGLLEQAITLSLFIPLLIGVGGNSGSQSATTVARALATDEVPAGLSGAASVIGRETGVGFLLGAALGLLSFPVVWPLFGLPLAATVSCTLVSICTLATLVGSGMPLLAEHLGIDPAAVSAPVVTTVVDASGLMVYFLIAKVVMGI